MPQIDQPGGASLPSPWIGRAGLSLNSFACPVTSTLATFNSNTVIPGTSGITVDATGKLTLPNIGKYLVQIVGHAPTLNLSNSLIGQVIPLNQVNCALSGENSDGILGRWTYDNNTGISTGLAGVGILLTTAANATLQLGFNISSTTATQTYLPFGIVVTITYLGT